MTKICFFEPRGNKLYGAQKSMVTLVENLDNTKYSSLLLTTQNGELIKYSNNNNIENKIIEVSNLINETGGKIFNLNSLYKLKLLLDVVLYNFKVYKLLRERNVDILYVNNNKGFLLSFLAAKLNKIPIIIYKRSTNYYNQSRILKYIQYFVMKFCDKVLCISKGVKNDITNKLRVKYENKISVLYTGYKFESFQSEKDVKGLYKKHNIKKNTQIIALIGSITHRKGYHICIESIKFVIEKYPNAKFMFIGSKMKNQDEYYNRLIEKAKEYKVFEKIIWTGYVNNINEYYNIIDCLILPSYAEGLPRTVIEALSNGIPVVANDVGGISEIIIDEDIGYIIKGNSSKMLANYINKCLDLDNDYKKKKRINFVKNKFSLKKYISGFQQIISDISY